jgi:hypothetical protein
MSDRNQPPADPPTPGSPAPAAPPVAAPAADSQTGALVGDSEIVETEASTKALFKDLGLGKVSAPPDLATRVPQLIERRSRGRFFGRKPLSERLPLEWLSIAMLALLALLYALMRLSPGLLGQP